MRVYKFLSKQYGLDNLTKRRIKISEYGDMNDPFELFGAKLSDRALHEQLTEVILRGGALCFSRNWRNPLPWSHYGDKHRGVCLGIDLHLDPILIQQPYYIENPEELEAGALIAAAAGIQIPADAARDARASSAQPAAVIEDPAFGEVERTARALLLNKFKDWRYEDEVRVLIKLREDQRDGGLYFAEFDSEIQPAELILGARCSADESEIKTAVSGYSPPIRVVKAVLSPTSFDVIEGTIESERNLRENAAPSISSEQ